MSQKKLPTLEPKITFWQYSSSYILQEIKQKNLLNWGSIELKISGYYRGKYNGKDLWSAFLSKDGEEICVWEDNNLRKKRKRDSLIDDQIKVEIKMSKAMSSVVGEISYEKRKGNKGFWSDWESNLPKEHIFRRDNPLSIHIQKMYSYNVVRYRILIKLQLPINRVYISLPFRVYSKKQVTNKLINNRPLKELSLTKI